MYPSPFGIVDKGDDDPNISGRTIHDLSFPEGSSINDHTDRATAPIAEYEHCDAIAKEILHQTSRFPGHDIRISLGEVAAHSEILAFTANALISLLAPFPKRML